MGVLSINLPNEVAPIIDIIHCDEEEKSVH